MIGRTLLHYDVVEEIGRGGMGEVYRARDTKLGRDVALKLLPADFTTDPERLHRFEREARLLATLSHPHVATIHGVEQDGDCRFLVLELVDGFDLAETLAAGRMPTTRALSIACQIAEGMEAAHERGIIHRDLKPANIKLTADDRVKILDFGLARGSETASEEDIANSPTVTADHTRDGTLLGTAPYMSPEQLRGKPVDQRTDIWAFGCVLYEMLTGGSPFRAESSPEIMARILEHEPDWAALPSNLPAPAARLLRRCLAKDTRQRLHSAADIRIVLQEIVAGDVEVDAPSTSAARAGRSRGWVVAAAVVLALVLGALGARMFPSRVAEPDRVKKTVRLMVPVRSSAALVPFPDAPSVIISPDGQTIVYVAAIGVESASTDSDHASTVLVRRPIDSFEPNPIRGTEGASSPFFSPDGEWVGFMHLESGQLRKVSLAGGIPQDILFVAESTFRGATWTEDGTIYFSTGGGISAVHEDGGESRTLITPDIANGEKTYRCPDVLPGGKAMLAMFASSEILTYDDADIVLIDPEDGTSRVLARGGMDPQYIPTGHIIFGRAGEVFAQPFDVARLEVTGPPVRVLQGVVTSEGYGSMQLSCSQNGTLVYVAGGPEQFASRLMIMHLDGRVEPLPQPPRPYGSLSLSPDAQRFAVSVLGANASIWMYDLRRDTMAPFISGWDNVAPLWEPDGRNIAFASNRLGNNDLWMTAADGSGEPTLILDHPTAVYPTSWRPDSRTLLAHIVSPGTGFDIWSVGLDGSAEPIIQSPAREARAVVSPDGRYITYASDESGRLEVYVQTLPITGRKWKLSEEGGDLARWSPDGKRIYFWNERKLMMVPVVYDPAFQPGRTRVMFQTNVDIGAYRIFPEGDRFVVLGRITEGTPGVAATVMRPVGHMFPAQSPDIHVVLNWFDDVERLTATD